MKQKAEIVKSKVQSEVDVVQGRPPVAGTPAEQPPTSKDRAQKVAEMTTPPPSGSAEPQKRKAADIATAEKSGGKDDIAKRKVLRKAARPKRRKTRFIGECQDIDELLQLRPPKQPKLTFEQYEKQCGDADRTLLRNPGKALVMKAPIRDRLQLKVFTGELEDVDDLYSSEDLRAVLGLLSPTSRVPFEFPVPPSCSKNVSPCVSRWR